MAPCFVIFWQERYQMKAVNLPKIDGFSDGRLGLFWGSRRRDGGFETVVGRLMVHCLDRRNITMTWETIRLRGV